MVLSKDDKALGWSRLIAGGTQRLGASSQTSRLRKLGAIIVDLTEIKSGDTFHHDKFALLAGVAPELSKVLSAGISASPGASRGAIDRPLTLKRALSLPIQILGAPVRILGAQ